MGVIPASDAAGGTVLDEHVAGCPVCAHRRRRETQLDEVRQLADSNRREGSIRARAGSCAYSCMPSPLGTLWLAARRDRLVSLSFGIDEAGFCRAIERAGHGVPIYAPEALEAITGQLSEYLAGQRRTFDLALDLDGISPFKRTVLEAVADIPYGSVQSYGEVAWAAGRPGAARAVGTAVADNPIAIVIPCHRVVRSDGTAGEYALDTYGACGVYYKLLLLQLEGSTLHNLHSGTMRAAG